MGVSAFGFGSFFIQATSTSFNKARSTGIVFRGIQSEQRTYSWNPDGQSNRIRQPRHRLLLRPSLSVPAACVLFKLPSSAITERPARTGHAPGSVHIAEKPLAVKPFIPINIGQRKNSLST